MINDEIQQTMKESGEGLRARITGGERKGDVHLNWRDKKGPFRRGNRARFPPIQRKEVLWKFSVGGGHPKWRGPHGKGPAMGKNLETGTAKRPKRQSRVNPGEGRDGGTEQGAGVSKQQEEGMLLFLVQALPHSSGVCAISLHGLVPHSHPNWPHPLAQHRGYNRK